jgi:hypothetical protein
LKSRVEISELVLENIPGILIVLIAFIMTFFMINGAVFSDFIAHLGIWRFYEERGKIPFPPLYYLSFYGLSLLIPSSKALQLGLLVLMLFSWSAKFLLSRKFLRQAGASAVSSSWLSLTLILFFPLYLFSKEGDWLYLGKMTPNVWHNGSSIFVWPFCFILFTEALTWISPEKKNLNKLLVLAIVILLIKPSYLFAFIPAMACFLLLDSFTKEKRINGFLFLAGLFVMILGSKYLIFDYNSEASIFYNFNPRVGVSIQPFAVWWYFAQFPFWDLLSSFLFLISALLLFSSSLWQQKDFQFSFLIVVFSLAVFFLLAEKGPGFSDANFYWQVPISLFILHLVVVRIIWTLYLNAEFKKHPFWKFGLMGFLGAASVLSGLNYLVHCVTTGYFY